MPNTSLPLQPGTAAPAAPGTSRTPAAEGQGLAGLFARIAAQMQGVTDTAVSADHPPPGDEAAEVLSTLMSGPAAGNADPAIPETTLPDGDLSEETALPPGLAHALGVLTQLQEGRNALPPLEHAGAGRADPLAAALQAVGQAAENRATKSIPAEVGLQPPQNPAAGSNAALNPLLAALAAGKENPAVNAGVERLQAVESQQPVLQASAQAATLINQAARSEATAAVPRFELPGNIQQPAWQQALAERVVMLGRQDIKQAELHLHPAELGPVNVRIETSREQAAVQFAAMNADTREALEAALPRLREYFNQQGMTLVRADVQHHFAGQQNQPDGSGASLFRPDHPVTTSEAAELNSETPRRPVRGDGLLDLYA